jgi:anti-anti-sigma regulatory factor
MFSVLSRPVCDAQALVVSVQDLDRSHRPRIDLAGALAGSQAQRLHKAVIDLLRSGFPRAIDLDFAGVTDLDATGIRVLETCLEDAGQVGCKIALRNLRPLG